MNPAIYVSMQGPSELGISETPSLPTGTGIDDLVRDRRPDAGDRRRARHDGPRAHGADGGRLPAGRYLYCPEGSHLAMYDDQETYFGGLLDFISEVSAA